MTVREIIYMVLDLAKASTSDDSFFTEDHVLFLLKKYRSFLIKKERERKTITDEAVEFESQQVCFTLEKVPAIDGSPCTGGYYLRTEQKIPKILEGTKPRIYPKDYFQGTNVCYVSRDKMRYLGTNRFLKNILYVTIGPDLHLYLKSSNTQFLYLKNLRMTAIFEDFDEAAELMCRDSAETESCDVLNETFPMRDSLVPTLIELVVKELTEAEYKPTDEKNNASDDLNKAAVKQG